MAEARRWVARTSPAWLPLLSYPCEIHNACTVTSLERDRLAFFPASVLQTLHAPCAAGRSRSQRARSQRGREDHDRTCSPEVEGRGGDERGGDGKMPLSHVEHVVLDIDG
jgi:hypothetical protein